MSAELGGQYSDVLSAPDVALYGGLTALASLERSELKASVMDSTGFRELLELNPEARAHCLCPAPQCVGAPGTVACRTLHRPACEHGSLNLWEASRSPGWAHGTAGADIMKNLNPKT